MKFRLLMASTAVVIIAFTALYAGGKAPEFTLESLEGAEVSLSDYAGKALFINFWATWCPPCKREIPVFNKFYEKYKERGFVILGISVDRGGAEAVKEFMTSQPIAFPVLLASEEVYDRYQALLEPSERGAIPTTFVVNRKGEVIDIFVGARNDEAVEKAIKKALSK